MARRGDPDITWLEADANATVTAGVQQTIGFDGETSEEVPRDGLRVTLETDDRYRPVSVGGMPKPPGAGGSVLGAGGLGVVSAVHDTHLGRQVALKELHDGGGAVGTRSSGLAARFLREARITAQLEHPSIVPVHELGVRADGRLYYTMKLVRGRTLAAALESCRGLPDRLALIGHFAAICHAVAYAHSRGVLHRDLKPANVMVGEFGETVVLDWGLAKRRDESDAPGDDDADDLPPDAVAHTAMGAVMGTPAYMSPEQADGRDVSEASDTWSLGAVLFEILTGHRPYGERPADELVNALRRGGPPRVREVCPDVPQDLAAIADKALSYAPADRYPTAREFAADVDAWRSGARVAAYEYGSVELLTRFVARHRAVVATAALALASIAVLGAVSWQQVVAQRDRAVAAERVALGHLGDALVDKAIVALADGDLQAAELFAAGALTIAEDPDARGVLLQLGPAWRPRLEATLPADGDPFVLAWTPDASGLATLSATELVVRDVATGAARWRAEAPSSKPRVLRFSADGSRLVTLDDDAAVHVWDASSGQPVRVLPAPKPNLTAFSAEFAADGAVIVFYKAGPTPTGLVRWDPTTGEILATRFDDRMRNDLRRSPDGQRLLAASSNGPEVLDPVSLATVSVFGVGLYGADWLPDGKGVVGTDGAGGLHAWDTDGRLLGTDAGGGGAGVVVASPDGRFVLERREGGRLALHETARWRSVFRFHATDVRAYGFSPDGRRLATADPGGAIRVWDLGTEPVGRRLQDPPQAAMEVAWGSDGSAVVTWDGPKVDAWAIPGGEHVAHADLPTAASIAALPEGRFAVAAGGELRIVDGALREIARHPAPTLSWLAYDSARSSLIGLADGAIVEVDPISGASRTVDARADAPWTYLASSEPGSHAYAVSTSGFQRVDLETGAAERVAEGVGDQAYVWAVAPGEGRIVFAMRDNDLVVWDLASRSVIDRFSSGDSFGRRMDVASDGARVAVGSADQVVRIWDLRTHTLLATLRGNENRIQAVRFSPDDRWLVSTTWDQTTHLWDLAPLATPAAEALAAAEARYGLVLDGASVRRAR